MRTPIYLRRGNKADLPALLAGEAGFSTDTKELFVGATGGNELIHSPSSFRAWQSAGQSITASTFTKVLYQTELYDKLDEYDATLSRFTCKNKGRYQISATVNVASQANGSQQILAAYKNGVADERLFQANANGTTDIICSGSCTLELNQNDYIEIYLFSVSACVTQSGIPLGNFSVSLF